MKYLFLFICFLLTFSSLYSAQDLLRLKGGKDVEVFVVKESKNQIEFKNISDGILQRKPCSEIERLVYKDADKSFVRGMQFLDAGNYIGAIGKFSAASKAMKSSRGNWHTSYIPYFIAYSAYMASKENAKLKKKSLQLLNKFIENHPQSRFAIMAKQFSGELYLLDKRYTEARQVYEGILDSEKDANAIAIAKVGLATAYRKEGKTDKALGMLMTFVDSGKITGNLMELLIKLLLEDEKAYKKGFQVSSKLMKQKSRREIKAKIYELRGCSQLHLKKYEAAFDDLLRAELLYANPKQKSSRVNLYLAMSLKALMKLSPEKYPDWEYQNHYYSYLRKMSEEERKIENKFKI